MTAERGESVDVDELRRQRDSAEMCCRELEFELGRLRAEVRRMELMMWRRIERRRLWESRARRIVSAFRR